MPDFENLSIFYNCQFVQDETIENKGESVWSKYVIKHAPIIKGTITGAIILNDLLVQTFVVNLNGVFTFSSIGMPAIKVINGSLDVNTGEMTFQWNVPPGENVCKVSYEYDPEDEKVVKKMGWRPPVQVNYKKPTFEKFLTTEQLEDISKKAWTSATWDFNVALGDTIREKYESIYVKCVELTNVLIKKGAAGYFWIATSPEVASIFETATYGFSPCGYMEEYEGDRISSNLDVWPMGGSDSIQYCGSINMKWRLYKDSRMPVDMVIIGCNDEVEPYNHYARLKIENFII